MNCFDLHTQKEFVSSFIILSDINQDYIFYGQFYNNQRNCEKKIGKWEEGTDHLEKIWINYNWI